MTMSDTWPAVWRSREDWAHPTYAEGGYIQAAQRKRQRHGACLPE